MNIVEMYDLVKGIYEENEDKYSYIGLRFEDKERVIGDICEYSKHNPDREDEREFPQFGSDEYEELEELDGTSAWDMSNDSTYELNWVMKKNLEKECWLFFEAEHCYVIAGDEKGSHDDPDAGENFDT